MEKTVHTAAALAFTLSMFLWVQLLNHHHSAVHLCHDLLDGISGQESINAITGVCPHYNEVHTVFLDERGHR